MKRQNRFLKSVKIREHITLLSDANVSVRSWPQQRAKYSSLQLKANCIAAKRCLRHYFKLICESTATEDTLTPTPSLTLLSVQNSNRMAFRLTAMASFPNVFFHFLQYSRLHPNFSAHRAALMTKTDLTCKFSFHEKRGSRQV